VDFAAVHRFRAKRFIVKLREAELWTGWRFSGLFVAGTQREKATILLICATELLAAKQFSS
jgi:hypothetical protein